VVAHPGHELRIFGWFEKAAPALSVITDGSGRTGRSRLPSTTRLVERSGAKPGPVYGALTDRQVYECLVGGQHDLFLQFADVLSEHFIRDQVEYVICDALEGYNPTHDMCRVIVDTAVSLAGQQDWQMRQFEFLLAGDPGDCPQHLRSDSIRFNLDDQTLARKLEAACSYQELQSDVTLAFEEFGVDAYRVEYLRAVSRLEFGKLFLDARPYYESYGERQVAAGHYSSVLRYAEHFVPIAEELRNRIERRVSVPI